MPALIASILVVIASIALAVAVLVTLPADYLKPRGDVGSPLWAIVRNVLGASLVLVGVLLAIPGVPGQGLIVLLAGLLLLDFPGKRRVLSALLGRPRLLHAINGLRRWFSQPPLDTADLAAGHRNGSDRS